MIMETSMLDDVPILISYINKYISWMKIMDALIPKHEISVLSWGYLQIIQVMKNHFSIETYGELGIPYVKKHFCLRNHIWLVVDLSF